MKRELKFTSGKIDTEKIAANDNDTSSICTDSSLADMSVETDKPK
jgi:hypothetical protein